MSVTIEPLQLEEIDEFHKVYHAAFSPLEADMILPMIFTRGLQPDFLRRFRERLLAATDNQPGQTCFCAKDTSSGEIVGISWWKTELHPPQTRAEADARFQQALAAKAKLPAVDGVNHELDVPFFKTSFYSMYELADGKPHVELYVLAVHPDHQRRGIASLLLRHGLDEADRLKLPTCLTSGLFGKSLYERYGFEVVRDFPFDSRQYGGRSQGKHWCMLRPAKS